MPTRGAMTLLSEAARMRISIIGAGRVGSALARNWRRSGHEIQFAVRDPGAAKYAALASLGTLISLSEAAPGADALVLATPFSAAEDAIKALGDISDKILLDSTDPFVMGPNGLALVFGHSDSAGERIAAMAPKASVFKVLNTAGDNNLGDSTRYPQKPLMLIAGDDDTKKPIVAQLVTDLGFEPGDAGPMINARLLEAHAMLWVDLAMKRGYGRNIAFGLLRAV